MPERAKAAAFIRSNLLVGLAIVLVIAALPALVGLIHYQHALRQEREMQARTTALRRSELVSASLGNLLEGTRQMLVATSFNPIVRNLDPGCGTLLDSLRRYSPNFTVMAVVRQDGSPVCGSSAQPLPAGSYAVLTRPFLAADGLVTGGYASLPGLDTGILGIALPFQAGNGGGGIVFAGLSLTKLSQLLGNLYQTGDMGLALADRAGLVVARAPDSGPVGTPLGATRRLLAEPFPGVRVFTDPNGARRIIGYVPPAQDATGLLVMAGMDAADLLTKIDADAARGYALIALGAACSILLALVAGHRYIHRPAAILLQAAQRWGSGNLAARATLPRTASTEFTGLAAAFNEMAELLQQQRAALQERADLELRLSRARHMEAVGTFVSGIAHNFNNMVGAIMGHLEMAAEGMPPNEPGMRHIAEIRHACERAHELVARMLDYGGHGSASRVPLQLEALLDETLSMLRVSLPMPLVLHAPAPQGYPITGEAGQLQQVFMNLVRNAALASRPDAAIAVQLSAVNVPVRLTTSHGQVSAGAYMLAKVVDRGVGMDPETVKRLFEPFFTTRPGGTGLGLATAWEIVRDHDGSLDVRSEPGVGTTVFVWLPALGPPRLGQHKVNRTILVLNANETDRLRDEDVIAALGYEPVGFSSAAAASEACHAEPDRFAAVVLDRSAMALDKQIGRCSAELTECSRAPVILIDSNALHEGTALAELGVVEVIGRPVRSGVLAAALARWT